MATTNVEITFNMKDGSTMQMTFGPYVTTASAITNLKANVIDFNSKVAADNIPYKNCCGYITNSNGVTVATDTPIAAATIITRQITELLGV